MISEIDHWLLEAPITSSWGTSIPFPFIFDGELGETGAMNLRCHGFDRFVVAESVASLSSNGLIEFKFPCHREELLQALSVSFSNLAIANSYTLTAIGFAQWERIANPDWTQFARHLPYCEADAELRLECASISAGQRYLDAFLRWDNRPLIDAVWSPCLDYRPFPWKTLAIGHAAAVRLPDPIEYANCASEDPWKSVRWIQNPITLE
ncbi:MAG: hypothetical protein ACK449_08845 [Planctomycetota bacterium]|jgi:hypothetical protein